MTQLVDKVTRNDPFMSVAETNALALGNKETLSHSLVVRGFDTNHSGDANASIRNSLRYFVSRLADIVEPKRYDISRLLFDKIVKHIDDVYHDAQSVRQGMQLNIRFSWEDKAQYSASPDAVTRKNIKNAMTVRIAVYYRGEHAYDINGLFAVSRIK